MITAKQVEDSMVSQSIDRVDHHDCAGCGWMVFYTRKGRELFFNPNCICVYKWEPPEPCEWQEAADWINMQKTENMRKELAKRFGISLE